MTLDYTLYVEGTEQISGLDTSRDDSTLALVTDLEKVFVYSIEKTAVVREFSAQLDRLPQQGSTEAVAFTSDDEIAVLYPDVKLVRRYSLEGKLIADTDLTHVSHELAGAMAVAADGSLLLATTNSPATLLRVAPDGSRVTSSLKLAPAGKMGEVVGLSLRDAESVYVATEAREVLIVNLERKDTKKLPGVRQVGEPSDIAYFVNPEDEKVVAIPDDADKYNGREPPIRLYLAP